METRMGRPYGRLFCLVPIVLLIAVGLRAAEIPPTTTQVHDTVYRANGTPAAGSVTISWGSDGAGLILRAESREFILERHSRPATYYLRAYDASRRYSQFTTVLRADYPL